MSVQAVIFDMDGVLVDTEAYWLASRVAFAEARGLRWTLEDQHLAMGRSTIEWARVMRERLHLDEPLDAIISEVRGGVIDRIQARMPSLPGAVEAVYTAASAYPVALASGSPTLVIDTIMALTGLDKIFKTIVYGDDMARGKPAPDIYLETARRLNVSPEACVGIEDSANGLRALYAAKMKAIAVPSPGFSLPDDVLQQADLMLPSLEGINLRAIVADL